MRQAKEDLQFSFGSESGLELQYPGRLVWPSPWIGHIPFAFWLIEALRPRVVVELGVHSGNSYCAFLQAIQSLALTAQCYGIDHWQGDEHSDYYGDDVYAELCSYHDPLYGSFSTLIRSTFEDALPYFPGQSVDLLHIDGCHTHEAVRKDFSDWLPKMSSRGVVLLHDINVREREFGVWRFWEEIASRYPTLAFVHSHGLGLAHLGTEPPPASLQALLAQSDSETIGRMRSYFARLGTSLIDRFGRHQAEAIAGRVRAGEAELEAARAEIGRHVAAAEASRIEVGNATARVTGLENGLAAASAEVARQLETAARLQAELAASRSETAHQIEAAARLEAQLSESRAETARQAGAAATFERLCTEARSELARQTDAARIGELDVENARNRIVILEADLEASRAEIARQVEAAEAARATTDEISAQVAAFELERSNARDRLSQVIAQRERATQLLRRQIVATAGLQRELAALHQTQAELQVELSTVQQTRAELQAEMAVLHQTRAGLQGELAALDQTQTQLRRELAALCQTQADLQGELAACGQTEADLRAELAALRQTEVVAALANRLATVKHVMPGPVKQFIKNRILGFRP